MHPRAIVLSPTAPEGVRVGGLGKVSAPPDVARSNVGVDVRAATPEQASAEASQRMAAVMTALKQAGIADKDLRTHSYSMQFEQAPQPPTPPTPAPKAEAQPATPKGYYRVTNMVEVTIHALDNIGRVLKAATDAGANSQWGVTFELEDDSALVSKARALAVKDAQRAAEELAKLTGVKLGEVVSVAEGEQGGVYSAPQPVMRALAAPAAVPVERGEIEVRYEVQLVYATVRD
jgi:uncharacterized protein YggE